MRLPKNKFLRLLINIGLIVGWLYTYVYIDQLLWINKFWYNLTFLIKINNTLIVPIIIILIPIFFITRYIWFEKSRNRIFYGLFSKFQPRIYTTISNADELKKYSELKDQGIITEDEFQAIKKKLLD